MLDRVRVQLQFRRQFARRGQALGGFQNANRNASDYLISNLAINGPRIIFPDLYQHTGILTH